MNKLRATLSRVLLVPVLCFAYNNAFTQETESDDEDIFLLSPFEVGAESDDGYLATATLAGSRIRSDVRDLGVSLAIITEDFLNDTGATDGESILGLVANVEVSGVLGNFGNTNDPNTVNTNNQRLNPQGGQRVRGLTSARVVRDYFQTQLPFDTYNTSRLEINRGPNSLLFGLGSPGGVINNTTNKAIQNSNTGRVSFRFDANGGGRATLNINRSLIDDRLAIRVAALNENVKFGQEPAFEDDQRFFVAAEYILFQNDNSDILGRTSLRGSYENVNIDRNPPDVVAPLDRFSSWWNGFGSQEDLNRVLAVPGVDLNDISNGGITQQQVIAAVNAGLATVPDGLTLEEYAAIEGRFVPQTTINRFARNVGGVFGGRNTTASRVPYFLFPALNYNSHNAQTVGWSDPELVSRGIDGINGRWRPNGTPTQDVRWSNAVTAGAGFGAPVMSNRDVFDYHNYLFQGTTNYVNTDYKLYQFFLTQEFFDGIAGLDAGVEIGYDKQERSREQFVPFSNDAQKQIAIDITTHHAPGDGNSVRGVWDNVPDSFANENLGRPVTYFESSNAVRNTTDRETVRATGFVTVNAADRFENRLGRILGSHTFTGLYEKYTNQDWSLSTRGSWWADTGKWPGDRDISNGPSDNFRRIVRGQIYLGDSVLGASGPEAVRMNGYIDVPTWQIGDVYTIWYHDNDNAIDQGVINDWRIIENINSGNLARQELVSEAISLQSKILWDHVSILVARRWDEQDSYRRLQETVGRGDPSAEGVRPLRIELPGINEVDGNFNTALLQLEDEPASTDAGTTDTWSVVAKVPEFGFFELPFGADLYLHYYEAESFQSAGISVNLLNQPLAPPTGETKEWGATLTLFDDRLNIRLNVFETRNANDRTNLGMGNNLNNILVGNSFDMYLTRIAEAENGGIPLFPTDATELTLTPDTTPNNRTRLSGTDADIGGFNSYDEYYAAILAAIPPELQSIYNFRIVENEGVKEVDNNPIPGVNGTQDFVADGFELDINGRITENISISANIAKQETVLSNIGPVALPFVFEIADNLQQPLPNSPGGWSLWDLRDSPFQVESGTIGTRFGNNALRNALLQQGLEGQVSTEQRTWRGNVTLRYDFLDGKFDGLTVGATARYQDEIAIGYPNVETTLEDGTVLIGPDVNNPFMGPDSIDGDFFIRYSRPITDKIDWTIQFNARNFYRSNGDDDIPISANPDGTTRFARIPVEQQYFLTNTFSF